MKNNIKKLLTSLLTASLLISLCPSALAAERPAQNRVTFSNVDQLSAGESMEYTITTPEDGKTIVGIKKMPTYTRANSDTWQVWYKGINTYVEFYMTVSSNRVTSVYDYSISLTGATYENAALTKTTTYGKLTFNLCSIAGIVSKTCWLKGTVTGSDNEITVDWDM